MISNIIGGFWLIDSLKDPILQGTVGMQNQPIAKFISVFFTLVVVCIYDFLTSILNKTTLFHVISFIYGTSMFIISGFLFDEFNDTKNSNNKNVLFGWIAYFIIESYGSLMVALFWSFTNSIMKLEQAKNNYGIIIAMAQIGAIIGSSFATNAIIIGVPQLCLLGSLSIYGVSIQMKIYSILFKNHIYIENLNKVFLNNETILIPSSIILNTSDKKLNELNSKDFTLSRN